MPAPGSSWRGRLSAVPLVAGGKVFTLDAGGTVSAFAAAGGGRVWSARIRLRTRRARKVSAADWRWIAAGFTP